MQDSESWDTRYRRILGVVSLMVAVFISASTITTCILLLIKTGFEPWMTILTDHFAATIGLAGAGTVSFAIVVYLRQAEGPIEFEAVGLKFRGAAGQVVLWAFCTAVLALCARLLW